MIILLIKKMEGSELFYLFGKSLIFLYESRVMYLVIVLLFLEFLPGKFDLIGIDFGLIQFLLNSQNFLF